MHSVIHTMVTPTRNIDEGLMNVVIACFDDGDLDPATLSLAARLDRRWFHLGDALVDAGVDVSPDPHGLIVRGRGEVPAVWTPGE